MSRLGLQFRLAALIVLTPVLGLVCGFVPAEAATPPKTPHDAIQPGLDMPQPPAAEPGPEPDRPVDEGSLADGVEPRAVLA